MKQTLTSEQALAILKDIEEMNKTGKIVSCMSMLLCLFLLHQSTKGFHEAKNLLFLAGIASMASIVWWNLPTINYLKRRRLQKIIDNGRATSIYRN